MNLNPYLIQIIIKKIKDKIIHYRDLFAQTTKANNETTSTSNFFTFEDWEYSDNKDFKIFIRQQEKLNRIKMIKVFSKKSTIKVNKEPLIYITGERIFKIQTKIAKLIFTNLGCSYLPSAFLELIKYYDVYYSINLFLATLNFDYETLIWSKKKQKEFNHIIHILIEVDCLIENTGINQIYIYNKIHSRDFKYIEILLNRLRMISIIIKIAIQLEYEYLETINGLLTNLKKIISNWFNTEILDQKTIEDIYIKVKDLHELQQNYINLKYLSWNIKSYDNNVKAQGIKKFRDKLNKTKNNFMKGKINIIEFKSKLMDLKREALENMIEESQPYINAHHNDYIGHLFPYKEINLKQCMKFLKINNNRDLNVSILKENFIKLTLKYFGKGDEKYVKNIKKAYINLLSIIVNQKIKSLHYSNF